MLAVALESEVDTCLAAFAGEVDENNRRWWSPTGATGARHGGGGAGRGPLAESERSADRRGDRPAKAVP